MVILTESCTVPALRAGTTCPISDPSCSFISPLSIFTLPNATLQKVDNGSRRVYHSTRCEGDVALVAGADHENAGAIVRHDRNKDAICASPGHMRPYSGTTQTGSTIVLFCKTLQQRRGSPYFTYLEIFLIISCRKWDRI